MTSQTGSFLNGVPVPAKWRERQIELGLDTVEQYEKAIQGFIGCIQANVMRQPRQKNAHSEDKLADCSHDGEGLSVALAMDHLLDNKKLLKALSHFQALLVSSCCAVLQTRGIPYETLDLIMQRCTSMIEADRRRLPTHAVTINHLINKLMIRGWSIYQATELFLINALSPSSLLRICSNPKNIESILDRLKGFEKHDFSDCLKLEYSIPGLIAHLISTSNMASDNKLSIYEICTILGYDPDKVPKPVTGVRVVHPAVTSTYWNFHVIGPGSFGSGLPQARESSHVHNCCVQPLPIPVSSTLPRIDRESLPRDHSAMQESLSQMARSSDRHIKHLCEIEPKAVFLLLLLRVVVGPVKLDTRLLSYAGSDRTRWATSGELETFKLGDVGLDHIISDLLIDSKEVERNLGLLNSLALISSDSWNVPRTIWLEDHLSQQIDLLMSSSVKMYWREQALILTSYFFIGNAYTKLFAEIGRLALPHFQRAISAFMESSDRKYLTAHLRNVLVEALIGSSTFSNMDWKTEALKRIRGLGEEGLKTCVKARITKRESCLLRAMGKPIESSQVILDYLSNHNDPPENPELNAIHGLMATSMAENLYENEEFNSAHEILHRWKILGASHHEIAVSRKGMILNGRIHLNEGNYERAKEFLEGAFETYDPLDQGRHDVTSYLIDVYCELEEPFKALDLLPEGQVAQARMNLHLRRCRNFLVSFAEASVCAARYKHAEAILRELKRYFDEISSIERMDQQRHLRTLILHAQSLHRQSVKTSQWAETLERWHAVDDISEKYSVIATTGMDYAVICLSISHVMHELGQHDESRNLFHLAINRLRIGGHFWRRGMGTYWFNFVWPKLSHLEGSNMCCLVRQGAGVCLAPQQEMLPMSAINRHSTLKSKS